VRRGEKKGRAGPLFGGGLTFPLYTKGIPGKKGGGGGGANFPPCKRGMRKRVNKKRRGISCWKKKTSRLPPLRKRGPREPSSRQRGEKRAICEDFTNTRERGKRGGKPPEGRPAIIRGEKRWFERWKREKPIPLEKKGECLLVLEKGLEVTRKKFILGKKERSLQKSAKQMVEKRKFKNSWKEGRERSLFAKK